MPRILQSPQARADADAIWWYIYTESANPDQADMVIDRINATYNLLASQPRIGKNRDELRKGLRSFPVYRYLILYYPLQDGIQVQRVLHGSRDLDALDFDDAL